MADGSLSRSDEEWIGKAGSGGDKYLWVLTQIEDAKRSGGFDMSDRDFLMEWLRSLLQHATDVEEGGADGMPDRPLVPREDHEDGIDGEREVREIHWPGDDDTPPSRIIEKVEAGSPTARAVAGLDLDFTGVDPEETKASAKIEAKAEANDAEVTGDVRIESGVTNAPIQIGASLRAEAVGTASTAALSIEAGAGYTSISASASVGTLDHVDRFSDFHDLF